MEPKRSCICIAIFLILLFPLNSTVGSYNDIIEADFLCEEKNFENVDTEDFVAIKYCSSGLSFPDNRPLSEFILLLVFLPGFFLSLPIPSTSLRTLRC
jgi:hypothetical protein